MADHRPDPGGIFASDTHRRVLAHLSTPDAKVGWSLPALVIRLAPDADTPIPPRDEYGFANIGAGVEALEPILADLKAEGFARRHAGDVWQMTKKGFEALTGPIANEPGPDAKRVGPAVIGPTPLEGK